tara:strand:- start:15838 stop:16566 length:729 start_codon:yes stop_codon:yes gene_type:complete
VRSCFQHHRATESFPNWVIRDCRLSFKKFATGVVMNKHIVYSDLPEFENYKDSTVLVLGGGPSTSTLDFSKIDRDYIWSCNHFFKNNKLANMKIDLAMMMAEVDLSNTELKSYLDEFKPLIGFEIHDKWRGYEFDEYEKYFCMHTDFYGKLGIGPRLLLFASALGCKEVKFAGLDGFKPIYRGEHAFEPGKKTLPSSFSEELFIKQYEYFWSYIKDIYKDVTYTNLGEGKELHNTEHNNVFR